MAALDLVSEVATDAPLLLVAEDAQWLDRPTSEVLAFVARRIESDPIVLLAAIRDGYPSVLGDAGLPEHRVAGLDDATAGALLDVSAPELPLAARSRVLREAAGNPLALLELPAVVRRYEDERWASGPLPLTERLERAFAARVSDLPDETRLVLLVAALDDGDAIGEILEAASAIAGTALDLDVVAPAVEARIIDVDLQTLRFRHPLIRSAVAQSAGVGDRRRAHEALATVLADQPDRRAWHRAALLSGEHEDIALELEEAGTTGAATGCDRRGGSRDDTRRGTQRAGEPQPTPARRRPARCRAGAARMSWCRCSARSRQLELGELERARVTWVEETALTRPLGDVGRFTSLIAAAERAGAAGDHDLHVDLLWLVASRAWWVDPGPEARRILIDASRRLGDVECRGSARIRGPRVCRSVGSCGRRSGAPAQGGSRTSGSTPTRHGSSARPRSSSALSTWVPTSLRWRWMGCGRRGGSGICRGCCRCTRCMAARLGDWDVAITAAEEARRLAEEFAEPQWAAAADTAISLVAAMRGDEQMAERLAARAEAVAEPRGANITMALAQFGKVLAALATGRHADAYAYADRLFDPADSAYHPVISSWLIADLAEAARHIDRLDAARARVAQVEATVGGQPGAWIALGLRHARALVAEPARGRRTLRGGAGERPDTVAVPARPDPARVRPVAQTSTAGSPSRAPFCVPRATPSTRLDAQPWSEQARRELRASGERSRRRVRRGARSADRRKNCRSPSSRQRACRTARSASGCYLSHRTISTHLYRAFPKLGITSRGELNAALRARSVV